MRPVHLVVLIHGLYGNVSNLSTLKEELEQLSSSSSTSSSSSSTSASASTSSTSRNKLPDQGSEPATSSDNEAEEEAVQDLLSLSEGGDQDGNLVVLVAKSIEGSRTWDGVDVNASRVALEIDDEIERLWEDGKDVIKFSVMGYSLGGLVARYLVGLLDHRSPSFFEKHSPASFSTIATPHIGILKYGTRANAIVHTIGRRLFSRSGQQMYNLDRDEFGHSLLEAMADPDGVFVRALRKFPKIMVIANGCHDLTVPYPSASISASDPFSEYEHTGVQVETNEDHIMQSYRHPNGNERVIVGARKVVKRRPPFPPFLMFRWPFTYAPFLILLFLLPLLLTYAALLFTLHTYQSYNRTKTHREVIERRPLLRPDILLSSSLDDETTPGESGTCTPRLYDPDPAELTSSDTSVRKAPRVQLHLTTNQKRMISNIDASLPQLERMVTWFPWAYNSHAMIIVRDSKRFPHMEDGRGAVRAWARFVFSSGET